MTFDKFDYAAVARCIDELLKKSACYSIDNIK